MIKCYDCKYADDDGFCYMIQKYTVLDCPACPYFVMREKKWTH